MDLTDADAVKDSLNNNTGLWLDHFVGYTVAMAFAVLFAVIIPLTGIIVCCCRKRGKCGGVKRLEGKHHALTRACCNVLLGLMITLLLLGVTTAFISPMLVREQTQPSGTASALEDSLRSMQMYLDSTSNQYRKLASQTEDGVQQQSLLLDKYGDRVQECAEEEAGVKPLMEKWRTYTTTLPEVSQALTDIMNITKQLEGMLTDLSGELPRIVANTKTNLSSCSADYCKQLTEHLDELSVTMSFSDMPDLSPQVIAIDEAIVSWKEHIAETTDQLSRISTAVEANTSQYTIPAKDTLRGYNMSMHTIAYTVTDYIDTFHLHTSMEYVNNTLNPNLHTAGNYYYGVTNFVSSVVLLLLVGYTLGLLYGTYGGSAEVYMDCCTRDTAAHVLRATMVLTFAVSWILLLFTSALFVIGGMSYTEVCQHLLQPSSSNELDIVDEVIVAYWNITISAHGVMEDCLHNEAFYDAFRVDERVTDGNITELSVATITAFQSAFGGITSATFQMPNVVLLTTDAQRDINTMADSLSLMDLQPFFTELEKNVTTPTVQFITGYISTVLHNITDSAVRDTFENCGQLLQAAEKEIDLLLSELASKLNFVKLNINSFDPKTFVQDMLAAEITLNDVDLSVCNQAASSGTSQSVETFIQYTEEQVRNSLGKCEPFFYSIWSAVTSVCVQFLYPFNAYWFSMGWLWFFLTITSALAIYISDLYRRQQPRHLLRQSQAKIHRDELQISPPITIEHTTPLVRRDPTQNGGAELLDGVDNVVYSRDRGTPRSPHSVAGETLLRRPHARIPVETSNVFFIEDGESYF